MLEYWICGWQKRLIFLLGITSYTACNTKYNFGIGVDMIAPV